MNEIECPDCEGSGGGSFWSTANPAVRIKATCKRCGGFGKLYTVQWFDGAVDMKVEPLAVPVMDAVEPEEEEGYAITRFLIVVAVAVSVSVTMWSGYLMWKAFIDWVVHP